MSKLAYAAAVLLGVAVLVLGLEVVRLEHRMPRCATWREDVAYLDGRMNASSSLEEVGRYADEQNLIRRMCGQRFGRELQGGGP